MTNKIIDNTYFAIRLNQNLSNLIATYNIKFAREPVDSFTQLDKVAFKWYGDSSKYTVICLFNNIVDPLTDLDDKQELLIPLNINEWINKVT